MKKVPFSPNSPDDNHCSQAVLKMILKYFIPNKNFSFKDLEKITNFDKRYWTWGYDAQRSLSQMGFKITEVGLFNDERFAKEGSKYLIEFFGKVKGKAQIEHSNIELARKGAKENHKYVKEIKKVPELKDIQNYLTKGYLVKCHVNSKALNDKEGYYGHAVLVYHVENNFVYLHDPGLPPRKSWKIAKSKFLKAWAYPSKELIGFSAYKLNK